MRVKVICGVRDARRSFRGMRRRGLTVGLVPTMGALHAGHMSLVGRARSENDRVVVSIFVNPTQYDDATDLKHYPRPFEEDLAKCEDAGTDIVLWPDYQEIYPDDYRFRVTESSCSKELEGAFRTGHFDGVMTVVLKLLEIVRPDRAYFGEKDWQQLVLIRDMVEAFFLDTEIVACPLVREEDGLAMSSRNVNLTPEDRLIAPRLFQILRSEGHVNEMRKLLEDEGFEVDYVERRDGRVLGAVRLGKVRLIDNVEE
ncbi:MAG: pantoate--beta-alanine ligase [Thermoanaerobaculales bacterium]